MMGLTTGKHGFPSEKQTPPLVNALLPQGETFQYAEERRLFYVALTRAKQKVYLLADMTDVSEFVLELMKQRYPVNLGEFDTSRLQQETEKMVCHQCGVGIMQPKAGQYGHFFSCSLYPRCKNKETPCTTCGSPMTRSLKLDYQVCINTECSEERPICKQCGREMKMRHSQFGSFWGCTAYRKGMKGSCSYKIDNKARTAT